MSVIISDGTGSGHKAKVDSENKLYTLSTTETASLAATLAGDAYNLNTGEITLTSSAVSGVLYFKNLEDQDFIVEALAVGVGSAGTTTDVSKITLIRNPTAGTLISSATAVDMSQNRNFSVSNTLASSLAYKGAEGSTVTDGAPIAYFYLGAGGRMYATIDFKLQKGDSLAVTVNSNTSSGSTTMYAAIVGYLR